MGDSFNLEYASILILDQDEISLGIMAQILSGFGAKRLERCVKVEEAVRHASKEAYDFIVVDATLLNDAAFRFIRQVRSKDSINNRFTTIMVTTGHATDQRVANARDSGANFIIAKPLRPDIVLKRIQWLSEDKREFVETSSYTGPDRRHKFEGPPPGLEGRRVEDQNSEIGDATSGNLVQEDIDRLMQPRKIEI